LILKNKVIKLNRIYDLCYGLTWVDKKCYRLNYFFNSNEGGLKFFKSNQLLNGITELQLDPLGQTEYIKATLT
jgi:hypothetical protein